MARMSEKYEEVGGTLCVKPERAEDEKVMAVDVADG